MALDTYSALQTTVASWLNREDLSTQIPDFIALAEARFNRELRVNSMMARTTITTSTGTAFLPADWLEHNTAVVISNGSIALQYLSPDEYNDLRNITMTGAPRYYTVVGTQLFLKPEPTASTTIEIVYYQKIPALSVSNTSNWLLARSPDLYIYCSLIQAEAYLQNDERVPMWAAGVEKIIADMKLEGDRARRPSGAIASRRRTFG